MSPLISPVASRGAPFKVRLESRIRFQLPVSGRTAGEIAEQRAVLVKVKKAAVTEKTAPTDKPLLEQPKGAIETALNFLYQTQKDIGVLGNKLKTATTAEQRTAIQSEIAAKTEEYNAALSSKKLTDATKLLGDFQEQLARAKNAGQRQAIKNEILANRGVLGDRLTNLLTSASDKDIGTVLGNLSRVLGTEITTEGAAVGVFGLLISQGRSEAGDQKAFNAAAEADKATGGTVQPTREVFSFKFDTPQNSANSLALLDTLTSSFEGLASQLDTGAVAAGLSDMLNNEPTQETITSPSKAKFAASSLKTNLEGATLLNLLNANNDLDRERARSLLAPY